MQAMRWSPSAANRQPWRVVYCDKPDLMGIFREGVNEDNRRWADKAPLLFYLFADRLNERTGKENVYAAFDTGAAWMSLALQAGQLGLYAHAMGGIHHERVYQLTGVDESRYKIMCAIAVGYRADSGHLPEDLQEREKPSARKEAGETISAFQPEAVPAWSRSAT